MHPVILHGHFYQPPREEPWLELVPRERSAAPDHDWNARITRECYAPLAAARVSDPEGRVRDLLNLYGWLSFNVGPTLFRWLDDHAPEVGAAMVAGDHESRVRLGHGNAIAMPYHHTILPLASDRDKRTEVRWGVRDFMRRFGRPPRGMWLPETAADGATLQVLAEEGIQFTILAPHQVPNLPPTGGIGRWVGAAGQHLIVCTYDGGLAHDVAFGNLLDEPGQLAPRLLASAGAFTALATDGETFGHHHRGGDRTLAAAVAHLRDSTAHQLTNYAALIAGSRDLPEVTLHEPSSWSCAHGVERWRMECGCRFDPQTNQAWRTPLRVGLDVVAQGVHAIVERDWPADAGDPWTTRDRAGPDLDGVTGLPDVALRLLEAERHSLAMVTSCGWFFDDIARIEPRLVLRHAARALDFVPPADAEALEAALRSALRRAESNDPAKGNGETIWEHAVLLLADGAARLAAGIAALGELDAALLGELHLATHDWERRDGIIITRHRRTGIAQEWLATPVVWGVVAHRVHVRPVGGGTSRVIPIDAVPPAVMALLRERAVPMVLDATLPVQARTELRHGLLEPEAARRAAFEATLEMMRHEGLERTGATLHAVFDLWALEETVIPPAVVDRAFLALREAAPSRARDLLIERLHLALPRSVP
jgi:hypothetical protein